MNILFISPSFPSEYHRIRSLNLLKVLSLNHKIFLISLSFNDKEDTEALQKYCAKIIAVKKSKLLAWFNSLVGLFTSEPLEIAYTKNNDLKKTVKKMVDEKQIDLIYVKRLRSAQFVPASIKIPVLLDTTDAMSLFYCRVFKNAPWFKKFLYWEEWLKYQFYEKKIAKKFKNWIVCSKIDIQYLQANLPTDVNFYHLPNVVDINYYKKSNISPQQHSLIFSGLMNKFVNIEAACYFVTKIFPLVLREFPDAKLYIVGPKPTRFVKRLASKNIIITGQVDDIRQQIEKTTIVICPVLTGTGTRNKILQAWSIGRPVVTTPQGLEGLECENDKKVLTASNTQEFANRIFNLWRNPKLYEQLVKSGQKLVESRYSLTRLANHIEATINKVCSTDSHF